MHHNYVPLQSPVLDMTVTEHLPSSQLNEKNVCSLWDGGPE